VNSKKIPITSGLKPFYRYSLNAILLLVIATSSVKSPAETTHYRWLDSKGNTVLSDHPPPAGIEYEVVGTESRFSRTAGNGVTRTDSTETENYKKNSELCASATKRLVLLTSSAKVKARDELGELRYLTPEEIEVERQTAEAQVAVYCE
jgi:hypothetical protein